VHFRRDINGLRGLAVLGVVLYHFGAPGVSGGFAGVDVFFVISGFLMTSIIFSKIEQRKFSLKEFYLARAKRIIPAMVILCLSLILFGWFVLSTVEYAALAKHSLSSLTFLSNIIYYKEAGYFDVSSLEKWLLHTWSLSVEWQFYIIYPLIALMFSKILSLYAIKRIALIFTISVFFGGVWFSNIYPAPAYFLLPVRSWEMLLGSLVYFYPLNLKFQFRKILGFVGYFLILISFVIFDSTEAWPGSMAAIPTIGTAVVLYARSDFFLTNNLVLQWLGKVSYSLYLWHWPIFVLGYYYGLPYWSIVGISLSIFLAYLSFRYVESSDFILQFFADSGFKIKAFLFVLIIAAIHCLIIFTDGANVEVRKAAMSEKSIYLSTFKRENYLSDELASKYRLECDYWDSGQNKAKLGGIDQKCVSSIADRPSILIWGDSHAQALAYGIRTVFSEFNVFQVTTSGCSASLEQLDKRKTAINIACDASNKAAFESVFSIKPDIIFFAQQKDHELGDFEAISQKIKSFGLHPRMVIIGPVPQWKPSLPQAIAKRHFSSKEVRFEDPYLQQEMLVTDSIMIRNFHASHIEYISLISHLCDGLVCLAKVDSANTPLVWDYGHLTPQGSVFVSEKIIAPELNTTSLD
jgi:peptidoglycan/LPS O-acetylase OafA/YrhL